MEYPGADVVRRAKAGGTLIGYWTVLDNPVSTERIALTGYDYVAIDGQHGLLGYSGILHNLMAIDAGHGPAGFVRVEANDPAVIGQALDAGARGVIVPLINSADDARRAVASVRYPSAGQRSYGPMRSGLRVGPTPAESNDSILLLAMIETPEGLADVDEICAVNGIDGVYIGPSDLTLAVGGRYPGDPDVQQTFDKAIERVLSTANGTGVIPGIHTSNGQTARHRREQGFRFITIASDLVHLEQAAAGHLAEAKS